MAAGRRAPNPEVIWCPLDPKPLPLNYRHEEETDLYFARDYNLRGRTPNADVDVCFNGNIAVSRGEIIVGFRGAVLNEKASPRERQRRQKSGLTPIHSHASLSA